MYFSSHRKSLFLCLFIVLEYGYFKKVRMVFFFKDMVFSRSRCYFCGMSHITPSWKIMIEVIFWLYIIFFETSRIFIWIGVFFVCSLFVPDYYQILPCSGQILIFFLFRKNIYCTAIYIYKEKAIHITFNKYLILIIYFYFMKSMEIVYIFCATF